MNPASSSRLSSEQASPFASPWPLIGVLHLQPLPGSPGFRGTLNQVVDAALADARALLDAGFDGMILENFGDSPFFPERVEAHTVAAMTRVALEVQGLKARAGDQSCALGINVLRNDAMSALAIAAMSGAQFIRVNVHVGAMLTDQGLIQGRAHETLRYRRQLEAPVRILADVLVKHAQPLGNPTLEDVGKDTILRGHADGLVISGAGTGARTDLEQGLRLRSVLPNTPVYIGSGLTLDQLETAMFRCSGAIVGTALKRGGQVHAPIDPVIAREFVEQRKALLEKLQRARG